MKSQLLKIYNWPYLSKEETNENQKRIRDVEWEAILPFLNSGNFLDVGCGAGYAMSRAKTEKQCTVWGIDPDPGGHGVGRSGSNFETGIGNITQGFAENLPYESGFFQTVYSSHVLEHVKSEDESLKEMSRVLKENGVLIIGMPTATMAMVNLCSNYLFTTHFKLVNLLFKPFIKTGNTKWWELFIPKSHSFDNKTILYDLSHYKIKYWESKIAQHFTIEQILLPALYPYPEYRQLFSLKKRKNFSSSVFFICRKK
jgi:ubiquinone/menaquinone biosynthesis C-methylase UbiE